MTENEKALAGREYDYLDAELSAHKLRAMQLCQKLNHMDIAAAEAREKVVRELFGAAGARPRVLPDFHCDNGKNIRVGDDFLANYNVTILDRAPVHIGDGVLIAPGTVITTVNHALDPEKRRALEARVHPYVRARIDGFFSAPGDGIRVAVVPLLFESHWDRDYDIICTVAGESDTGKV